MRGLIGRLTWVRPRLYAFSRFEPELRRGAQGVGKLHGHCGGDAAFFVADLVDDADLDANIHGAQKMKPVLLIGRAGAASVDRFHRWMCRFNRRPACGDPALVNR